MEEFAAVPSFGTIVVIEDEDAVRNFVVDVLEESGFKVISFDDGPALNGINFDEVDLLITDLNGSD